jgi:hypothetical protein
LFLVRCVAVAFGDHSLGFVVGGSSEDAQDHAPRLACFWLLPGDEINKAELEDVAHDEGLVEIETPFATLEVRERGSCHVEARR